MNNNNWLSFFLTFGHDRTALLPTPRHVVCTTRNTNTRGKLATERKITNEWKKHTQILYIYIYILNT